MAVLWGVKGVGRIRGDEFRVLTFASVSLGPWGPNEAALRAFFSAPGEPGAREGLGLVIYGHGIPVPGHSRGHSAQMPLLALENKVTTVRIYGTTAPSPWRSSTSSLRRQRAIADRTKMGPAVGARDPRPGLSSDPCPCFSVLTASHSGIAEPAAEACSCLRTEGESGTGFWCIWGTSFRGCLGFLVWPFSPTNPVLEWRE